MNTITLVNGLKSLFAGLGAKTSDSNYAVGLFDKTSAEPKGIMGMSDLASVLGVKKNKVVWKSQIIVRAESSYQDVYVSLKYSTDNFILYMGREKCMCICGNPSSVVVYRKALSQENYEYYITNTSNYTMYAIGYQNTIVEEAVNVNLSDYTLIKAEVVFGCSTAADLASLLGERYIFKSQEDTYTDLNDMRPGIFYNGNMLTIQNAPSEIISTSSPQCVVLYVKNGPDNRGMAFAFSALGVATRFLGAGGWTAWKSVLLT